MIINPVSILPNAIDSSTAEKRKQRDNRHLPKKTSHQTPAPPLAAEENPSQMTSTEESFLPPFSKADGEEFEEQGQREMSNNAFKGTYKKGTSSRISHSSNQVEALTDEEERTPKIDITV